VTVCRDPYRRCQRISTPVMEPRAERSTIPG
jgi:hypothetical protein